MTNIRSTSPLPTGEADVQPTDAGPAKSGGDFQSRPGSRASSSNSASTGPLSGLAPKKETVGWDSLPPELKRRVADTLPLNFDRTRVHLSMANRATHGAVSALVDRDKLNHETASSAVASEVANVSTLSGLRDVLARIRQHAKSLRFRALAVAADCIERLPSESRVEGFDAVLQETKDLSPKDRAGPLMRLGLQIAHLPDETVRKEKFDEIFAERDALSREEKITAEEDSRILNGLCAALPSLPAEHHDAAVDRILTAVDKLPLIQQARPLGRLGYAILGIQPAATQRKALSEALNRTEKIPGNAKSLALGGLAVAVHVAAPNERKATFDRLFALNSGVDEKYQGLTLEGLSTQIHSLLDADKTEAFTNVFNTIKPSHGEQHYKAVLMNLSKQVADLPHGDQGPLFDQVLAKVAELDVGPRFEALGELIEVISRLSPEYRFARLMSTAGVVASLQGLIPERQILERFVQLQGVLPSLTPEEQRLAA